MNYDWRDRTKQPHCNICGQFAYWNKEQGRWELRCVLEIELGVYEHK